MFFNTQMNSVKSDGQERFLFNLPQALAVARGYKVRLTFTNFISLIFFYGLCLSLTMKITIEIDSKSEMEKLSALFKTFKINTVKIISFDDTAMPVIKGDKKIDPKGLFGIWASKPRSLENIRKAAWQRNQYIG